MSLRTIPFLLLTTLTACQSRAPSAPAAPCPALSCPAPPSAAPSSPTPAVPSLAPSAATEATAPSEPTAPAAPARDFKGEHLKIVDTLPAGVAIAVTLDLQTLQRELIEDGFGMLPSTDAPGLRQTLRKASVNEFGVDLLSATTATVWFVPARRALAVWLAGPLEGTLRFGQAATTDVGGVQALSLGEELYAARIDGRVVIGNSEGLALSAKAPDPQAPGVAAAPTLVEDANARKGHATAVALVGNAPILASFAATPEVQRILTGLPGFGGEGGQSLEGGAFAITGALGVDAAVTGPAAAITALATWLTGQRGAALGAMRRELDEMAAESFTGGGLVVAFLRSKVDDLDTLSKLTIEAQSIRLSVKDTGTGSARGLTGLIALGVMPYVLFRGSSNMPSEPMHGSATAMEPREIRAIAPRPEEPAPGPGVIE